MWHGGIIPTVKHPTWVFLLIILISISGCIQPVPASIQHCFDSNNWAKDHYVIQFFENNMNYQCVEEVAIREHNPKLCTYLNASVDDACVQDYYEQVNDPNACEQIYGGMKENCIHHYYLKQHCMNGLDVNAICVNSYIATVNRPDFCLSLPNEKECITNYFTSKKDPTICDQLWDEYTDACKQYYAINDPNRA